MQQTIKCWDKQMKARAYNQYVRPKLEYAFKCVGSAYMEQEAQLSLRDRATRACQLKSGKVLHKCRRLVFEKLW